MISAAIDEGQLGPRPPTTPVYGYNAIDDEISTIAGVDALTTKLLRRWNAGDLPA